MTKKILFFVLIAFIGLNTFSQRGQRIGFVDMNYILENIPAYAKAQVQLDKKVTFWQQDLDKIKNEIAVMQTDLSNEKALLTDDLIADKEEDIVIKQLELKKKEEEYFSSNGSLFLLRKQLVTPIQDQVYNASQEIAKARKYDFVFDKSSDLIMLYSNKANDISELVLRSIVKGEKISAANLKREEANKPTAKRGATPTTAINNSRPDTTIDSSNADEIPEISVADERDAKRAAAFARIEQQKLDRAKKREVQKAAIEKKRQERVKKQEEIRNQLKTNKDKKENDKKEDSNEEEKEDEKNENNN